MFCIVHIIKTHCTCPSAHVSVCMYCVLVVVGITVTLASCEQTKLQHLNPLIRLTLHPPAHPEAQSYSLKHFQPLLRSVWGTVWWPPVNDAGILEKGKLQLLFVGTEALPVTEATTAVWSSPVSGIAGAVRSFQYCVFTGDSQCMAMKKCLRNYVFDAFFFIIIIHNMKNIP